MNPREVIHDSWFPIINSNLHQEPLLTLNEKVLHSISYQPQAEDIFNVFSMDIKDINVVILGQDPYPTPGDACGYAFINGRNTKPASLRVIEKEILESDERRTIIPNGIDMRSWIDQGVFLLNTALTVETGKAGSHLKYWTEFTKRIISYISVQKPCIWVLWGRKAQEFIPYINYNPFMVKGYGRDTIKDIPASPDYNYILTAPHPAAESYSGGKAGFYGCNHFYFINEILVKKHINPITW